MCSDGGMGKREARTQERGEINREGRYREGGVGERGKRHGEEGGRGTRQFTNTHLCEGLVEIVVVFVFYVLRT